MKLGPPWVFVVAVLMAAAVAPSAGCVRHTRYRGAFAGRIVDGSGHPVPNATVVVCTTDGAQRVAGCPRRADAWTDPEGRFQFAPVKVKERRLGDAQPTTRLTACGRDGHGRFLLASSVIVDASGATEPQIEIVPPDHAASSNACVSPE